MSIIVPIAMMKLDLPTGLVAGEERRPVTGSIDASQQETDFVAGAIPITIIAKPSNGFGTVSFGTVTSPSPTIGASAFQDGFQPIPTDPANGGPA